MWLLNHMKILWGVCRVEVDSSWIKNSWKNCIFPSKVLYFFHPIQIMPVTGIRQQTWGKQRELQVPQKWLPIAFTGNVQVSKDLITEMLHLPLLEVRNKGDDCSPNISRKLFQLERLEQKNQCQPKDVTVCHRQPEHLSLRSHSRYQGNGFFNFFKIADCLVYIKPNTFYLLLPTASGNTAVSDVPFSLRFTWSFSLFDDSEGGSKN